MDEQIILGADDQGNFTGEYFKKSVGHTGKGKRHLAVCVLIQNSKEEVLLQRRKHKIFNNIWDVTGATNNLHLESHNESFEDAATRCLKEEYNIEGAEVKVIGSFNYFIQYGKFCENEHCAILVGKYDGRISPNPQDAYEVSWISKKEFLKDLEKNPDKYTKWCNESIKLLKEKDFFK